MKITGKAIDGKEFKLTVESRSMEEIAKAADIAEMKLTSRQNWFIVEADDFNPKTKAQQIKNANDLIENMIEDYEYDNGLRD